MSATPLVTWTEPAPPPPLAVTVLFGAIRDGRVREVAHAFAPAGRFANWDAARGEIVPRSTARGPDAIARSLARAYGSRPELHVCISDGPWCFLEGRTMLSGGRPVTFVSSLRLDARGEILRFLGFRCPLVEPAQIWRAGVQPAPGAARSIADHYLRQLVAGDFAAAAACFAPDALYSHPPYRAGEPRVAFHGRDAIEVGFRERRGVKAVRPVVVTCIQRGRDAFVEGAIENLPGERRFLSSLTLDADGLIERYVAFSYEELP